jgi:hypothetical protein
VQYTQRSGNGRLIPTGLLLLQTTVNGEPLLTMSGDQVATHIKSNSWASEVLPVKDELCRSFSQYHRQASLTTRNIRSVHHLVLFRHPRPSHHLSQTARRKGDTQVGQEIVSKEKNRLLSYKKGPHFFREE